MAISLSVIHHCQKSSHLWALTSTRTDYALSTTLRHIFALLSPSCLRFDAQSSPWTRRIRPRPRLSSSTTGKTFRRSWRKAFQSRRRSSPPSTVPSPLVWPWVEALPSRRDPWTGRSPPSPNPSVVGVVPSIVKRSTNCDHAKCNEQWINIRDIKICLVAMRPSRTVRESKFQIWLPTIHFAWKN